MLRKIKDIVWELKNGDILIYEGTRYRFHYMSVSNRAIASVEGTEGYTYPVKAMFYLGTWTVAFEHEDEVLVNSECGDMVVLVKECDV